MPGHVEGQGFHRRRVTQIVQLLEQQDPDDDMQILRWPAEPVIEVPAKIVNRKRVEKMVPKNTGPGSLQQPPTLLSEIRPVIKQFTGPSVP